MALPAILAGISVAEGIAGALSQVLPVYEEHVVVRIYGNRLSVKRKLVAAAITAAFGRIKLPVITLSSTTLIRTTEVIHDKIYECEISFISGGDSAFLEGFRQIAGLGRTQRILRNGIDNICELPLNYWPTRGVPKSWGGGTDEGEDLRVDFRTEMNEWAKGNWYEDLQTGNQGIANGEPNTVVIMHDAAMNTVNGGKPSGTTSPRPPGDMQSRGSMIRNDVVSRQNPAPDGGRNAQHDNPDYEQPENIAPFADGRGARYQDDYANPNMTTDTSSFSSIIHQLLAYPEDVLIYRPLDNTNGGDAAEAI